MKVHTAKRKKCTIDAFRLLSDILVAVPSYRSTSSIKRENASQRSEEIGCHVRFWLARGIEEFQVEELVTNEGNSEKKGASRRS